MAKSIAQVLDFLEKRAPAGTAEDWDNVGLLAGDPKWKTERAVVSIDLTQETIQAAQKSGARLILTHHPCIFPRKGGLNKVVPHPRGGMSSLIFEALQAGIAVISSHTNFDQSSLEPAQAIASGLGAEIQGRLLDRSRGALLKLVVFVPETHLEKVRDAICEAGAGIIGQYSHCSFSVSGNGSFLGGEGTDPHIGEAGRLETAAESRLETILPRGLERPVLEAMRRSHPYEEVAYDLYSVEQGVGKKGAIAGLGYGFFGDLKQPRSFAELAQDVRKTFKVNAFRATEPVVDLVRRIGFAPGAGGSFQAAAVRAGCDVLITGEASYHGALAAQMQGMTLVELGHRESEFYTLQTLGRWLDEFEVSAEVLNTPTQKIWF